MAGMEPDYLIAFNIGAIWNVIFKWVERGMEESLDDVRSTLEKYLHWVYCTEMEKTSVSP